MTRQGLGLMDDFHFVADSLRGGALDVGWWWVTC